MGLAQMMITEPDTFDPYSAREAGLWRISRMCTTQVSRPHLRFGCVEELPESIQVVRPEDGEPVILSGLQIVNLEHA